MVLRWAPNQAAWRARWQAARAAVTAAGTLPNPRLSVGWEDFGLGAATGVSQLTLSVAASLARLASRPARTRVARHELAAMRARIDIERLRIATDVWLAYDDLVAARRRVGVTKEVESLADLARAGVAHLVDVGTRPRFDLERAEAELARARMSTFQALAEERAVEAALAFTLGFAEPEHLTLAEPMTRSTVDLKDVVALLRDAVAGRPEIREASEAYNVARARAQLTASRLRYLPDVALGPRLTGGDWFGVASLDVEIPLFDDGRVADASARADLIAAVSCVRRTAHEVAREVSLARMRSEQAREFLKVHARDLTRRRRALLEKTRSLYEAGEATYAEFLQARRDDVDARETVLSAERASARAEVVLSAAVGRLLRSRTDTAALHD